MHEAATHPGDITDEIASKLRGAIHFLNRTFPLVFEDREFYIRALWQE
jgi:hypothetical protein